MDFGEAVLYDDIAPGLYDDIGCTHSSLQFLAVLGRAIANSTISTLAPLMLTGTYTSLISEINV